MDRLLPRGAFALGLALTLAAFATAAHAQERVTPDLAPAMDPAMDPASGASMTSRSIGIEERPGNVAAYGAAARLRWITVPRWLLNAFLAENVPLSTYGFGAEFFRRKRDKDDENAFFDIALGFGYQNMSPADGNWLGRGKDPSIDTDLVQFRNFGLVAVDASFLWRQYLTNYFGLHYGAGLGLAMVTGKILRTSNSGCTAANAGDVTRCKPIVCRGTRCTEAELKRSEGEPDRGSGDPHRFVEDDVPGAIPILNMLLGINFRLPEVRGLDMRIEAGWYDAFFIGTGVGYLF